MNSSLALGEMCENGESAQVNTTRASEYYLTAAEMLSPVGQWKVANAFEKGIGARKDTNRAVYYLKLCAGGGHEYAQYKYMELYTKAHGVERPRALKCGALDSEEDAFLLQ